MTATVQLCQHISVQGPMTSEALIAALRIPGPTLRDALSKIKRRGLVTAKALPGAPRNMKVYSLTDKGRAFAIDQTPAAPVVRDPHPRFAWRHGRVASVFELGSAA